MKTLRLKQTSEAWHNHRAHARNASEAAAVLACSPYMTRDELLHAMHTGIRPEPNEHEQRRFDDGHAIEAMLRPVADEIVGEPLYPVVGVETVDGIELSASFDGLTMAEDINWECKTLNDDLRAAMPHPGPDGNDCAALPKCYRVQMEQQLAVCNGEKVLFTAGTQDGSDVRHCWYYPDPPLRTEIIGAWKQFDIEREAYVPVEVLDKPVVAARGPDQLPALRSSVTGTLVLESNVKEWEEAALVYIKGVASHELVTDEDFENGDAAAKWCDTSKTTLQGMRAQLMGATGDVNMAVGTIDRIIKELDTTRNNFEKAIKARKDARKLEIVSSGREALTAHLQACNARFTRPYMPTLDTRFTDFNLAVKGKSSLKSMQSAVNDQLAAGKIEANRIADGIDANVKFLNEQAGDMYRHLFADVATIVLKASDDFHTLVNLRITEHKAAEQKRLDDERERIRKEEQERADREARERIAREQQEEAARQAAAAPAPAPTPAPAPIAQPVSVTPAPQPVANVVPIASPRPAANEVASLSLGKIGERLGFSLPAEFLALLGIQPAARERAARLYTETQYDAILAALGRHIQQLQQKKAA